MVIDFCLEFWNNDFGYDCSLLLRIWRSFQYLQFYFEEYSNAYCNNDVVKHGVLDTDKKERGFIVVGACDVAIENWQKG